MSAIKCDLPITEWLAEAKFDIGQDRILEARRQLNALLSNADRPLNPITEFFILDAHLSRNFAIPLQKCVDKWREHMAKAKRLHAHIWQDPDVPEVYKEASLCLRALEYLVNQDNEEAVCTYKSTGCNFIVSIVESNMCICSSYTFYVNAVALQLKLKYVRQCSVKGHVFTVVRNESGSEEIGIDNGFPNNNSTIEVSLRKTSYTRRDVLRNLLKIDSKTDTERFPLSRTGTLRLDPAGNLRTEFQRDTYQRSVICAPVSRVLRHHPELATLLMETRRKFRSRTMMRNVWILAQLYPPDVSQLLLVILCHVVLTAQAARNLPVVPDTVSQYELEEQGRLQAERDTRNNRMLEIRKCVGHSSTYEEIAYPFWTSAWDADIIASKIVLQMFDKYNDGGYIPKVMHPFIDYLTQLFTRGRYGNVTFGKFRHGTSVGVSVQTEVASDESTSTITFTRVPVDDLPQFKLGKDDVVITSPFHDLQSKYSFIKVQYLTSFPRSFVVIQSYTRAAQDEHESDSEEKLIAKNMLRIRRDKTPKQAVLRRSSKFTALPPRVHSHVVKHKTGRPLLIRDLD